MIYFGITPAQVQNAEIICSGSFAPAPASGYRTQTVQISTGSQTFTDADRKIVPFTVDYYWKGDGPQVLDIARFDIPHEYVDVFTVNGSPNNVRYLLLLKKDTTGSTAYQLVDLVNSWMSLPEKVFRNTDETLPDKIIEAACVAILESYATYIPPPVSPTGSADESQFMVYQSLQTLMNFETNNDKTIQALEAIYTNPNLSTYHGEAFDDLQKIDPKDAAKMGMTLFDSGALKGADRANFIFSLSHTDPIQAYRLAVKLDGQGTLSAEDRLSFARGLGQMINTGNYSQMDPAFIEKMIAGDDQAEDQVCSGFFEMREDPRAIPWLGHFLDNSNPEIQFRAMEGLLDFIHKGGQNKDIVKPDSRQIHSNSDPVTHHGQPYPEEIVSPYKAWVKGWLAQHPEYALPAAK